MSFIVCYLLIGLGYTVAHFNAFKMTYNFIKHGEVPKRSVFELSDSELAEMHERAERAAVLTADLGPRWTSLAVGLSMAMLAVRSLVGWPYLLFRKIKASA